MHYKDMFTPEVVEVALAPAQAAAYKIRSNPKLHLKERYEEHSLAQKKVDEEMRRFHTRFKKYLFEDAIAAQRNAIFITPCLVAADYTWLPAMRDGEINPFLGRPFDSNIVLHGFFGKSTGRPEYNAIFKHATTELSALHEEKPGSPAFENLSQVLREHYVAQPADRPQLTDVLSKLQLAQLIENPFND